MPNPTSTPTALPRARRPRWPCRVIGHDIGFRSEGRMLVWHCRRGCGRLGTKTYSDPAAAQRYAAAFDHRPGADLGRRAPLIGLFPLRMWHRFRRRDLR